MSLDERIASARAKRLTSELFKWPRIPLFTRTPSENERQKKVNDIFKCVHGVHYFTPCKHCRRTQDDANEWMKFWQESNAKLKKQLAEK